LQEYLKGQGEHHLGVHKLGHEKLLKNSIRRMAQKSEISFPNNISREQEATTQLSLASSPQNALGRL